MRFLNKIPLFLCVFALAGCFASCQDKESGSQGLAFKDNIGGKTCTLTGIGTCTDSKIVVPSSYQGKPVVSIGAYAFLASATLTEIVIPEGVTTVADSAFKNCDLLTTVAFPASLEKIEGAAFSDCNNLTSVRFSKNAKTESIGASAFESCTSLESVSLPVSLKKLGNYSFMKCSLLKTVEIPEGSALASIGWSAFWDCTSLTEIRIPAAITYMEWATFKGCTALQRAYVGTKAEFAEMTYNSENTPFKQAEKYYYSETEPKDNGKFWRFVDGKITVWE